MKYSNNKWYSISYLFKSKWIIVIIVAVAYVLAAKVSSFVKIQPGNVCPLYAASGIALAAVIIFKRTALIGVFFGSLLSNEYMYQSSLVGILLAFVVGIGSIAAAGVGANLIRRFCNSSHPLSTAKNVIILVFFGGIIGTMLSAAIGAISLSFAGYLPRQYFFHSLINWWVGDATGVIVLTPLILSWNFKIKHNGNFLYSNEALLLIFSSLVLCYLVFVIGWRFDYFLSILLVYAAFRFDHRVVSLLALVIAISATMGPNMGERLNYGNSANITFIHLISFINVSICFALILAGIMNERKLALMEIERYQNNLEHLVAQRTNDLESANEELKSANEELYSKNIIINEQNDELKTTMQNLQETQLHLMQAEKMASLGVLTAGVAHEINNPLNFIMGGYIGLENYFNETGSYKDERIPILLSSIQTGIDRASDIIKGLNQFSRNNETLTEVCDIHLIINNCLLILNNQLENKIEVQKNFTNEVFSVTGNVGKLHQVFINILSNSIHAIEHEGKISITTYKQEGNIIIEIIDTGVGISKTNLKKITDPFYTTKDPGKGTGLGLSIAYRIIQDHKGKIEFQSELTKGTSVKINLPTQNIIKSAAPRV